MQGSAKTNLYAMRGTSPGTGLEVYTYHMEGMGIGIILRLSASDLFLHALPNEPPDSNRRALVPLGEPLRGGQLDWQW